MYQEQRLRLGIALRDVRCRQQRGAQMHQNQTHQPHFSGSHKSNFFDFPFFLKFWSLFLFLPLSDGGSCAFIHEQVQTLPFNKYSWLTTHNSFARLGDRSATGSLIIAPTNQQDSITEQLNVCLSFSLSISFVYVIFLSLFNFWEIIRNLMFEEQNSV